ncbi:Hypothetical protein azo2477 [Azoarcus olearius]|uniref:Uncharacterized protein n=1 Tax=Azoarcus sp. (strain BH72) TaxID=418699 RepID=A1K8D9_AZOSB|nr:Hypothetical protein azo2477 [Azoarcus olearius]
MFQRMHQDLVLLLQLARLRFQHRVQLQQLADQRGEDAQ